MQRVKNVVGCFSGPFSAVINFQKQFVDDVIVNVKKQSEEISRHNHELQNRRVRLHLDHLEEEYLCCVCGRPGEERDADDVVSDEFSIVHMPSKERIEQAIVASGQLNQGGSACGEDGFQALGPQVYALLGVLSTSAGQNTSEMVAKVQHCILNQEAARRQKRRSTHRDKGLMKIEESDIEIFQQFFKRPVHGYLCSDCHNSAKRRLDALTSQIQMILFKGKTPFLRSGRAAAQCQRPEATTSPTWPVSTVVISNFCARTREHNSAYLSDASITRLRESFHCAVCKRRKASFFLRQSATFLCQFCCSRDRFYRDNATCINDELMPKETAHLLESLARCQEKKRDREEHNALLGSGEERDFGLFREHNAVDLFATQLPPHASIDVKAVLPHSPSLSDRRSVAGNLSVSLFSGKKFLLNLSSPGGF
ncbi:hypothetical protein TcG_05398 [Trypanosoma cruzi]|uniref:Uncharacterized protein n=2 Tax=Trypanosoma cruzi TaxID=5693 RepID=V5ATH1_TRYCR|nr:hypothetical protein TCDM_07972 [Trypanosoma cruzi Dm28c]KAF8283783.1 hypothetical protein TcBrA4_0064130 [Trypanosoma cruzi]PBJ73034.1 hypothetical protein BCY84_13843 [Trypanosoma cruzi cruzi]PWU88363.1 hypothetical protein C4B63_75g71 [Trypanosoma cruzi]RNF17638.1 hypothetical protein TcG_05398 [Trypanosoma cruzi]